MDIDVRDEAFLKKAETLPVDAVAMAETFDDMQEREDLLSYEKRVQASRSLIEAVRLDVFRVLAIMCKDDLTVKRFVESLAEDRVREQFDSIADEDDRAECVREVFDDIAEEAVDTVLPFDERYAEVDPRSKKYKRLVRSYVVMLAERHKVTQSGEDDDKPGDASGGLSNSEERALMRDAAVAGVKMEKVINAFRELADSDEGEEGEESISTPDALGTTAFFDVLDAFSDATDGTITMKGFRDAKGRKNVRDALFRLEKRERRACLEGLSYEIAQLAVMADPLFAKAVKGREHDAELIASNYALRLVAMHS